MAAGSIDDTSVNMPAGGTITYTVQATIASSATGTLSNAATLTPPAGVTKTANDTANDSDALTPEANLKITKIDSGGGSSITGAVGKAVPGRVFTYTVVVTNTGPSDAAGTSIIDALSSVANRRNVHGLGNGRCHRLHGHRLRQHRRRERRLALLEARLPTRCTRLSRHRPRAFCRTRQP